MAWSVLSTLAFTGFQFAFDSGMVPGAGAVAAGEVPADLLTVMAENEFTKVLLDIDDTKGCWSHYWMTAEQLRAQEKISADTCRVEQGGARRVPRGRGRALGGGGVDP